MTSKAYTFDGNIEEISMPELYDGKPFFRKMTHTKVELEICRQLLMIQSSGKPIQHVVHIYDVGANFVDMELLDETYGGKHFDQEEEQEEQEELMEIISIMRQVKNELQLYGILYIDWKIDNIGFSKTDNTHKLFDFDCSGLIDVKTKEWIKKPKMYYSFCKAIAAGKEKPLEIDDYIFETETFTETSN